MVIFIRTSHYRIAEVGDGVHGPRWEVGRRGMHSYPSHTISAHRMEVDLRRGDRVGSGAQDFRDRDKGVTSTSRHPGAAREASGGFLGDSSHDTTKPGA